MHKGFKILIIALLPFFSSAQKSFNLLPCDSFLKAVDKYYYNLSTAQIEELKQTNRLRFLNYIPSPGYSPFTGGVTLSFNILAPLQEIRNTNLIKQKIASIKKINELECESLKNEIKADYEAVQISIYEFNLADTLEFLTLQAFNLSKKQFERNELLPSAFLAIQKSFEQYKLSRVAERNAIRIKIFQLFIKSKMPIAETDWH